jgi:protein-tyrosine phosphatase
MKSILVICEGNICRSPMAEGLLAHHLPGLDVRSAGLGALAGHPADEIALELMKERGIDISGHRAVQLTREMCLHSDIVLAMTAEQKQRVEQRYPQVCGRVFRLGEFSRRDVPDPYRQPEKVFREVLALIESTAGEWLPRIQKLTRHPA